MKKSAQKITIRVCPGCNSTQISPYMGFYTGWQYECKKCGYIGALTKEIIIGRQKLKKL